MDADMNYVEVDGRRVQADIRSLRLIFRTGQTNRRSETQVPSWISRPRTWGRRPFLHDTQMRNQAFCPVYTSDNPVQ
jgi:hypothetical protein